jgi:hypothetical protein
MACVCSIIAPASDLAAGVLDLGREVGRAGIAGRAQEQLRRARERIARVVVAFVQCARRG